MIDDKESDEGDHISKIDEETIFEDKEIMKVEILISKKIYIYTLRKHVTKLIQGIWVQNMESEKRE